MTSFEPGWEERVRAATEWASAYHRRYVEVMPADAHVALAELDRLREQRVAVLALCGEYDRADLCGCGPDPAEIRRALGASE